MKGIPQDDITAAIKAATDILFFRNPLGTAMGVLFGFVLHGIVIVLSPFIEFLNNIRLNLIYYLAVGIFVFNIRYYLQQRNAIPEEVDDALSFIQRQADTGAISHYQAQLYRQALIKQVLESFTVKLEPTDKMP
jgi:hypothetical protein